MVFLAYLLVGDLLGIGIEHFKVRVKLLHLYESVDIEISQIKISVYSGHSGAASATAFATCFTC